MFVIVLGWVAFALVRYRARPDRGPSPTEDHFVREGVIAATVAGIVVVLLVVTLRANGDITRVRARPAWRVEVTAYKWGRQFRYPALPGVVDRTIEGRGPPVMHVPANATVQVTLHTLDVTHAFWVPAVRFKRDAWPGTRYVFDLKFSGRRRDQRTLRAVLRDPPLRHGVHGGRARPRRFRALEGAGVSATVGPAAAREPVRGLPAWVVGTDHKSVAGRTLVASLLFLLAGGALAMLMRSELAAPGMQLTSRDGYDQWFTMHGSTMVHLVVTPAALALGTYLVPLQVGAAEIAAPRVNLLGFLLYQVYVYRTLVIVAPFIAFVVTKIVCDQLRRSEVHPLRGGPGRIVRRGPDGSYETAEPPPTA
ncbi:MAG TPA: cbb3-type cytochrome c oxidase subunit I [Solirubrobacteraceae bacterium]|nr:cbb3-type cytochrome c oxidase subunit I [Solirubrobacteraceae bacterium]